MSEMMVSTKNDKLTEALEDANILLVDVLHFPRI